jgi:predicted nucleic acid-binding protein
MRRAFLDTSYLLALLLRKDEHHAAAIQSQLQYEGELVTTEYVLVELHDALSQVGLRPLVIEAVDRLMIDPNVVVVPASRELFTNGRELFRNRAQGLEPDRLSLICRHAGTRLARCADRRSSFRTGRI